MLSVILYFIKSHAKIVAIGGVVTFIITTISIQHLEIKHLQAKIEQSRLENITLDDSNKKLIAAIKQQNNFATALQQEAQKKHELALKALAKAKITAGKYRKKAANIKMQKPSANECQDVMKLLNSL